jgi:hypothetical protein
LKTSGWALILLAPYLLLALEYLNSTPPPLHGGGVEVKTSEGGVMNKIIMKLKWSYGKCLWRWRKKF